jgi:parallel beta-helix repeat protein
MPGETPYVASVQIENGLYWAFDGITFTSDGRGGNFTSDYMLSTQNNLEYLKVTNCTFCSGESSAGWSKADWYEKAEDAVIVRGNNTIFNNNLIKNVYFALQIEGDYTEVKNNMIDNFGADAVRALGSFAVYEGNVIRDAYIEDYGVNHDDAIQMYNRDNIASGVINEVRIVNNTIYQFADPITRAMIDDNLVGYSMQGIIITDGHIENSVVENNLVVSDHYHGITLFGAVNCRIQNNTVMKTPTPVNPTTDAIPWIQYTKDKQGNECSNSIIRNNIASKLTPWTYDNAEGMITENNLEPSASSYTDFFVDYYNFDFHLKETGPAVGAGINKDLSTTDIEGNPRLAGTNVDCGAYEYQYGFTGDILVINASPEDGFVSDPALVTDNNPQALSAYTVDGEKIGMKGGSSDANGDANLTSIVIPFRLPELPAGKEITSASLRVYVNYGRKLTDTNLDLYGLECRTLPDISTDDYYSGEFGTGNGNDTPIADNFISKNVAEGEPDTPRWEETSADENVKLLNYIKARYSNGAVAGDYLFMRLSVDNVSMNGFQFFGISDATMTNPPELSLKVDSATGIISLRPEKFSIYPNPVINGRFKIEADGFETGSGIVQFYSLKGMLVSEKRLNDVSGTVTVNLKPGVYVVRLTTGNKIYLSKLLIK